MQIKISSPKADTDRLRGCKIEIYPNNEQKEILISKMHSGKALYNWALEIQNREYDTNGKSLTQKALRKRMQELKRSPNCPEWLNLLSLEEARLVLDRLTNAFERFYSGQCSYPQYKSKRKNKMSYSLRNDRVYFFFHNEKRDKPLFENGEIKRANLDVSVPLNNSIGRTKKTDRIKCGKLDFHPDYPYGRIYSPCITYYNGRFFLSFTVEKPYIEPKQEVSEPIGIDLGIRKFAVLSDGTEYIFTKNKKLEKRLKRQNRRVSRDIRERLDILNSDNTIAKYEDIPVSKNAEKRMSALRKTKRRISNINHNFIRNMAKEIVDRNPEYIVMEDIKVREIIENRPYMNKYIPQMMFYTAIKEIKYRCEDRKIPFIQADKHFPSSMICSCCGNITNVKITQDRLYKCPVCGLVIDRDLNAAINLRDLAY